jgi:hypothetical protein
MRPTQIILRKEDGLHHGVMLGALALTAKQRVRGGQTPGRPTEPLPREG